MRPLRVGPHEGADARNDHVGRRVEHDTRRLTSVDAQDAGGVWQEGHESEVGEVERGQPRIDELNATHERVMTDPEKRNHREAERVGPYFPTAVHQLSSDVPVVSRRERRETDVEDEKRQRDRKYPVA